MKKIYGTFGVEMRAYGQKLVKFCTHTHTHAAKLVVEIGCCKVQEYACEGGTEGGGNMLESKRWWHLTLECKGDVSCVVFLQVGVRGKDVSLFLTEDGKYLYDLKDHQSNAAVTKSM